MLTEQITFLTTLLLLTLSLPACNGLAAPTPAPSTATGGQIPEVVTFTEEPVAAPIEPTAISVTVADTQAMSLNAPAAAAVPLPIEEPAEPESPAVSPAISAESVSLTTELIARPRSNMNIRQGPGTDYPIIGSAVAGERFNITGRNEAVSWLQVSSEAIAQGWLYADLVEISGDALTAPVVQADDIPYPPAETETQPVVPTVEEPSGTIYFALSKPPEGLGYFDPATGQSGSVNLDGVQAGGIYKISPDGTNLTPIKIASDAGMTLSPDGQRIAFNMKKELVGGPFGTYFDDDIYMMNSDGTGLVNLTNSPDLGESGMRWLPDGQRLVYLQSYDSAKRMPSADFVSDIYVLDVNQTAPLNLTHHPAGRIVAGAAVSPNGRQVAFISQPAPGWDPQPPGGGAPELPETLSIINLDGSGRLDLLDNPPGYELRGANWSPDSQRIALIVGVIQRAEEYYDTDIHLLNPDGTQQVNITNTPDALEADPVWSPDGQQLAVSCDYDKEGGVYSKNEMTGIQFFSRDGVAQTACLDLPNTYAAEGFEWSPDGQQVAIFAKRWLVDGTLLSGGHSALFTIKADGTDLIQITDSGLDAGYDVAWSPGGQWLVFSARPRIWATDMFTSAEEARTMIEYKIYMSRADGSRMTPLTEGNSADINQIEWQP